MDKHEYEVSLNLNIAASSSNPSSTACATIIKHIAITEQYIASIEAELAQLKADSIDLMQQVEVMGRALDMACEAIQLSYRRVPIEGDGKREYFLKKAGE